MRISPRNRSSRRIGALACLVTALVAGITIAAGPAVAHVGDDTVTAIDGPTTVQRRVSIAIDSHDRPVIAYIASGGRLMLIRCDDATCSGPQSPVLLDGGGATTLGPGLSLALDDADHPVIAYRDATDTALKLLRCPTQDCTGALTPRTVDSVGDVGADPSLAIDADGLPVIAYHDAGFGDLKILRCDTVDCSDPLLAPVRKQTGVDDGDIDGIAPSLVLDAQDRPVVSYWSASEGWVVVMRCANAVCQDTDQLLVVVDIVGTTDPVSPSITLDADDLPVVAYEDPTGDTMRVVRCESADCIDVVTDDGEVTVPRTPDPTAGLGGADPVVVMDSTGVPVIAYTVTPGADLGLLRCRTDDCRGTQTPLRPDTAGAVGGDPAMVLDADGNPAVAHIDTGTGTLRLLRCGDPDGCGTTDVDLDGAGADDNCPGIANPTQSDLDGDGLGDACDDATGAPVAACAHLGALNVIVGTRGADILEGTAGNDLIIGRGGNDIIRGGRGHDCIIAGGGNDVVFGGGGRDVILGRTGDDRLVGQRGADVLLGNGGRDRLGGGSGDDRLGGGAGNDSLFGHRGDDRLTGGKGRDRLVGGPDTDSCDGGPGDNTIDACE